MKINSGQGSINWRKRWPELNARRLNSAACSPTVALSYYRLSGILYRIGCINNVTGYLTRWSLYAWLQCGARIKVNLKQKARWLTNDIDARTGGKKIDFQTSISRNQAKLGNSSLKRLPANRVWLLIQWCYEPSTGHFSYLAWWT